jgi:hypothetical protein
MINIVKDETVVIRRSVTFRDRDRDEFVISRDTDDSFISFVVNDNKGDGLHFYAEDAKEIAKLIESFQPVYPVEAEDDACV